MNKFNRKYNSAGDNQKCRIHAETDVFVMCKKIYSRRDCMTSTLRGLLPALRVAGIRITSVLLSLLFGIVAARTLGTEEFGKFATVIAAAGLIGVIGGLGLPYLTEREVAKARGNGQLENLIVALHLLVPLILVITGAFLLAYIYDTPFLLPATAFIVTGMAANFLSALLRGFEHVELSNAVDGLLRPATAIICLAAFWWFELTDIGSAITAQTLGVVATILVFLWIIKQVDTDLLFRVWSERSQIGILSTHHRIIFVSGLNFAIIQFAINLRTQSEILWLGYLSTPEDVAYFFAAARAASAVAIFHGAVLAIASPKIVRLHTSGHHQDRNQLIGKTARQSFLLVLTACIAAFLLADPYFMLFGSDYKIAKGPLSIMLVTWFLVAATGPVTVVLIAFGQERVVWIAFFIGLAIGGIIAFLLVPSYGMIGASCSFLVTNVIIQAILISQLKGLPSRLLLKL